MSHRVLHGVASDGVPFKLHRWGHGGIPLVMIPGMFSDHTFFQGTRGHGMVHHMHRTCYVLQRRTSGPFHHIVVHDVPSAVELALQDKDHHSCSHVFLMGHSAGAGASLCAASSFIPPHHLAALCLLSVPHPNYKPLSRRAALFAAASITKIFGKFPARLLGLSRMDEAKSIFLPWIEWLQQDAFPYRIDLPSHLPLMSAVGSRDVLWSPVEASRMLHEEAVARNGASHLNQFVQFEGYGHGDLVTAKTAQDHLWKSVADWLCLVENSVKKK